MTTGAREVVERFTFRNGAHSVSVRAVIDSGAESTSITPEVAAHLELPVIREVTIRLADDSRLIGHLHRCVIAWSDYERQGFFSAHDVICQSGETVLIGLDFLKQHELMVDLQHMGLVGRAPPHAEPLTGGGYVLNPPKGFVREWNYARAQAAKPGEILRPHPAWRFTIPAIQKKL
jgi:predicted aspartyl protease